MTDTDLARRLERLERDNRRMKWGGVALLAIIAALVSVYATRPLPSQPKDFLTGATRIHQKVMAREFDVVDGAGNVRIKLTTTAEGASIVIAPNLEPAQDVENTPVVTAVPTLNWDFDVSNGRTRCYISNRA